MQPTSHLLCAAPDITKTCANPNQIQLMTAHPIPSNRRQTINSHVSHQILLDELLAHYIMHIRQLPPRRLLRFLIYFLVSCMMKSKMQMGFSENCLTLHTINGLSWHTYFCPYVRSSSTVSIVLYFSVSTGWYQRTSRLRSVRSFSLSAFDFDCGELVVPLAVFFTGFVGDFRATPPLFWTFSCWCCSDILKPTLCSWWNIKRNKWISNEWISTRLWQVTELNENTTQPILGSELH